jgi:predicted MFS family arabinose efflux permease
VVQVAAARLRPGAGVGDCMVLKSGSCEAERAAAGCRGAARSISLGGLIGGLLIERLGTVSITWTALALLVVAAFLVIGGKTHAFPPAE